MNKKPSKSLDGSSLDLKYSVKKYFKFKRQDFIENEKKSPNYSRFVKI